MENSIFDKAEFDCLTEKQKVIMTEIMDMSKGQTAGETAGMIMRFTPLLESDGSITQEQKKAMAKCLIESMSEEERQTIVKVFQFAGIL